MLTYKYQVNFDKVFIDGPLKGHRYHDHQRFILKSEAIFFAKRDGLIISAYGGDNYRQEESQIIDLSEYA